MKSYTHITHPSGTDPKIIEVEGLGKVSLRAYEGQRQARLADSAFPLCASGSNDKEAVENLRVARASWMEKMSDSD